MYFSREVQLCRIRIKVLLVPSRGDDLSMIGKKLRVAGPAKNDSQVKLKRSKNGTKRRTWLSATYFTMYESYIHCSGRFDLVIM